MGSYLSIANNTDDPWTCKIGPDEAALKIAGIAISVVGTLATVIGTAGAAAPVASALAANGVVSVFGVSTSALAAGATVAASVTSAISITGSVSGFGIAVAQGINDHLITDGYVSIAPGDKHQWGKMSLSLWQQGTCVRTTIVDEKTVTTDTLYMRPIFSGATDNSNIDHEIQFWIDKFGLETETVTARRIRSSDTTTTTTTVTTATTKTESKMTDRPFCSTMGSYLSIANNTDDPWTCKIGPDEAALKIAGIAISVVGTLATVIGTAGAAAPVASALAANGVVSVFGVSTSALAAGATVAASVTSAISITGSVSGFGIAVAQGINDHLITDGYVSIAPGDKHQWGKMSLSLWQQGTCVRTTIVDEKTVTTDTLYMRPIFSGATDNSNIDHEIQFWIDKFGLETETVTARRIRSSDTTTTTTTVTTATTKTESKMTDRPFCSTSTAPTRTTQTRATKVAVKHVSLAQHHV
ncbi:hypothetical protein GQ600_1076 [Phytophthora cactorum]|nr:hypothetical protein GQ600_1076 [Phytophthora cactorum]